MLRRNSGRRNKRVTDGRQFGGAIHLPFQPGNQVGAKQARTRSETQLKRKSGTFAIISRLELSKLNLGLAAHILEHDERGDAGAGNQPQNQRRDQKAQALAQRHVLGIASMIEHSLGLKSAGGSPNMENPPAVSPKVNK